MTKTTTIRAFRFISVACLAVWVGGCDLFQDSNPRPSHAYAWNKNDGRLEYWFTSFETRRDCIEATRDAVATTMQKVWYSEPVGCGYFGNNYWRVRLMNAPYSADHECIVRNSEADAVNEGRIYGPALKGYGRPQGNLYCY